MLCLRRCLPHTLFNSALVSTLLLSGCGDDSAPGQGSDAGTGTITVGNPTSTSGGPGTATEDTQGTGTSDSGTSDSATTLSSTSGPDTDGTGTATATTTATDSGSDTDGVCEEGTIICEDGVAKVCDGMGGFSSEEACEVECAPDLGCVDCMPGTGYCDGDSAYACNDDGTGYELELCDGLQGITCDDGTGTCVGSCTPLALGTSYIGCDYYPTVTPNPLLAAPQTFSFAVVVANTAAVPADITVTQDDVEITTSTVGANSVEVITLPWVDDLRTGGTAGEASKLVQGGAYRLRSTEPVTVYQYNPLEYAAGGQFSYTNDASLLLPTNTWRDEVRVVSWNHFSSAPNWSAFYAVVAAEDDTEIQLDPSATGVWINPGAGVMADGTGNVTLNASDVLVVFTANANVGDASSSDPSGTLVTSTKPIQVLGGHVCIYIPEGTGYCDHIEESVPPLEAVGKDYFVTVPLINAPAQTKARMVRIVATEDNTTLTYDPPVPGAPAMLANAGDVATINATTTDFRITSPQKILVSEYMQGQDAGGSKGDPAMTLAVPLEQYRNNYLVHAPTNYTDSFANIVAPTGATVTVDGVEVADWTAIGAGEYSVARVVLSNAGDGNHVIDGTENFGIQVYGYGQYTSYWYPGGQDLVLVPQ